MLVSPKRFYWVSPNLAGMSIPNMDYIDFLKAEGITMIISLTEEVALDPSQLSDITIVHCPVKDYSVPTLEEAANMCMTIYMGASNNGKVAVHCTAGCGRTGTILASYFVSLGTAPADALKQVRDVNPAAVETPEQEQFLTLFSKYCDERAQIQHQH